MGTKNQLLLSTECSKEEGDQDVCNIAPVYVVTHHFSIDLFAKIV